MRPCASTVHFWISIDLTCWNVFGDLQIGSGRVDGGTKASVSGLTMPAAMTGERSAPLEGMGLTFACQRARVAYRIEIWDDRETRPKTDRADGRSRGTARCFRRSSQAAWPAAGDKHRLNVFWLKALQCEAHRSIPNFHSRREQGLFGRERPDPGGRTQGCAGHPARTWKGHLRVSPPDLTHRALKR